MTDKYTKNILEYIDKTIVARIKDAGVPEATYFFETEDHTSLEAVSFDLRTGSVSSTMMVSRFEITYTLQK
jgi:hypothetical protein